MLNLLNLAIGAFTERLENSVAGLDFAFLFLYKNRFINFKAEDRLGLRRRY